MLKLVFAAWAAWAALHALPGFPDWRAVFDGWATVPWGEVLSPALALAPFRHGAVVAAALAAALAFAGAGGVVRAWHARPGRGRGAVDRLAVDRLAVDRLAVGVLLGFAAAGAGLLGLALAGLFHPGIVVAVVYAGLVLPGSRDLAAGIARSRPWRGEDSGFGRFAAVAAGPAAVFLAMALVPDAHVDAYTYHLAIPEQFLRVHRFTAEATSIAHQFPLTAELVYAAALAWDREELAHWLQIVPFAAGASMLVAWAASLGGRGAGWVALILVATYGEVGRQAAVAKNDLAAAGFGMAAIVLMARGRLLAAALLFGCGSAVKFNVMVLAGVAAAFTFRRRGAPAAAFLAALPVAPWLAKTWLMAGDPLWPVLAAWWPGALWDPESAESVRVMRGVGSRPFFEVAAAAVGRSSPLLLALFPAGLALAWRAGGVPSVAGGVPSVAAGGMRGFVVFAAVATAALALVMKSEWERLALPVILAFAAPASLAAVRAWGGPGLRPGRFAPALRGGVLAAAALSGWLALGGVVREYTEPKSAAGWLAGSLSRQGWLAARLTTVHETAEAVRALPGVRRIAVIGDCRTYRFPGRVLPERCYGRTWGWVLAGECRTPGRIRVRMRQMNCTHIVYNFVTERFPHRFAAPFTWDWRRLARWRAFVARDLEVAVKPRRTDHENGGFCVYALRGRPLKSDPPFLPYMPGIESLYYEVTRHGQAADSGSWRAAALVLHARLPGVDYVSDLVADGYWAEDRWAEAYQYYLPGATHGTVGDQNFWSIAVAASYLGRFDEAFRYFTTAIEVSPYLAKEGEAAFAELRRVQELVRRFR